MSQEPLFMGRGSNIPSARYAPIMLGQTTPATCPSRSLWWLVFAAGVGGIAGWSWSKSKRKGRR